MSSETKIAFYLATSGHSGVDRVMKNLLGEISARGIRVDLLQIANHGPHLESVPTNVRLVPLGTSHVNSSFPALVRYLRQERPMALLSDKDRLNRLAIWGRKVAGVPTRVAVRIGSTVSESLAMRRWLDRKTEIFSYRRFYPLADAVIVPSQGAAVDFARVSQMPVERVQAIPSPVVNQRLFSLSSDPPEHPWYADGGPPIVLGVGELCLRKDFSVLIRAFSQVIRRRPARLIILGEGRQREELMQLVRDLNLSEHVSLPGFVANPYAYMNRSHVFALTSRNEGSPVVLMEALAVGIPCVSTDCPSGPREILQEGRIGPLVDVGDVDALAQALLQTIDKPLPKEVLQAAARPFTVEVSASRYLEVLGVPHAGTGA